MCLNGQETVRPAGLLEIWETVTCDYPHGHIQLHKQPQAAFRWYSENFAVIHEFKRSGCDSVKMSRCSGEERDVRIRQALSTQLSTTFLS